MWTRHKCCRDRYDGVCLYADGKKVACTPENHGDPGRVFSFKYFNFDDEPVVATEFKIMWSTVIEKSAQIEELFFHYTGRSKFSSIQLLTLKWKRKIAGAKNVS